MARCSNHADVHDVIKQHVIAGACVVGERSFDNVNADRGARAFDRGDKPLSNTGIEAYIGDEAGNL